MDYKKPQSTLVQGGAGIYPLTTADQVILADGSRLEKGGKISADSAANSAKLGGKAPEYYIQPRNLLDNSDFRKPVNQQRASSYSGTTYIIDRWWMQTDTGTVSIGDDGLTFAANDSTSYKVMQYVEKLDSNKVHTFVIKDTSENVYLIHSVPNERYEVKTSFGSIIVNMTNINDENRNTFSISLDSGTTITLAWAALYEGAYTADTLPPYVPKGYAAELAACNSAPVDLGGGCGGGSLQAYPVGAVYISINSTSPASLFGGTWEQLKDRFLLGAGDSYTAGNTGGKSTHTLTLDEIPSHGHSIYAKLTWGDDRTLSSWTPYLTTGSITDAGSNGETGKFYEYGAIINRGGGAAHNNMPPYLAVYMWKRVS